MDAPIPSGIHGVDTLVSLVYGEGVTKRELPPTWMARALAEDPARLFGLYPRKGTIQLGSDAELLIVDPDAQTTIRADDLIAKAGFTPFEGLGLPGLRRMTMLLGQLLFANDRLEPAPGFGTFLPAGKPSPPIAGAAA